MMLVRPHHSVWSASATHCLHGVTSNAWAVCVVASACWRGCGVLLYGWQQPRREALSRSRHGHMPATSAAVNALP
jgi:hypothetical protein